MEILKDVTNQAGEILSGGNAANGASEDVVEHQGGNGEFSQATAERLFYRAIDTATNEHAAAFDVNGADGIGEQHDAENEPGGSLTDVALGFTTGVISGGGEVVENDGSSAPEGDEA